MFSYIHIPFCESKCKYCRFASLGSINKVLVNKYIAHLLHDIKNFKRPEWAGLLNSVYFWGGTPSILEMNQLSEILESLKTKFGFEKNIEITLESTPINITAQNLIAWEALWINRISMWIQTLNNKALQEIKRDSKETIFSALEYLKNSKIKNISVDFIIWLPYVQAWETLQDIKYVLENYNFIKHISVYMLEDYYVWNQDDSNFEKITYPETWKNLGLEEEFFSKEYLEIKSYLESTWFFKYELSNFSKSGYECKHNISYWNHSEVIWFWLGSHSFVNNTRYAYKDDFLWYYKSELEYEEVLNERDFFLEKIMFWFRTSWLEKKLYNQLNQEKINNFIKLWYINIENDTITIHDNVIHLMDKIISEII